jgi:hypothetical protein
MRSAKTVLLVSVLVFALAVPGFAGRKTDTDGNIMAKDVLSGGGGLGLTSPTSFLQSSIAQEIIGRSTNSDGGILIGGYINAWRPLGGGGEEIISYDFATSSEGWSYSTVTGYSLPTSGVGGGMITMSTPSDDSFRFGFWQTASDAISYEAGMIYRARYVLQTDQATADAVPQIRFRFSNADFSGSSAHYISSLASFSYGPPTAGTKEYRHLYYPAAPTALGLTFDLLDFGGSTEYGAVRLDQVIVEKINRSLLSKKGNLKTYTSFGTWSWNPNFGNPAWSGATSGGGSAYVSIASASQPQAAFWQCADNEMAYDTGTEYLYRATFTMERGAGDAAATMPWCRLRCFNEDSQMSQAFNINNGNSGVAMPPPGPGTKTYEVYWQRPDLPGSPGTSEDGFKVAIDMLNFGTGEQGTYRVNQIDVEYFDVPAYSP